MARAWSYLIAGVLALAANVGSAQAQNYDGGMILRVGAFAQANMFRFGVTKPTAGDASSGGLSGGMSAGIDYAPSPHWLFGVEFDAALGDARANFDNTSFGHDYTATLRGRFGIYPNEKWLIYGTAGLAFLGFEAQRPGLGNKVAETVTGLTIGVGAEYNWHHVILFGEYDYAAFGNREFTIDNVRYGTDADAHLLRFGIKFKVGHDHFGRFYDPMK